MLGSSAWFAGLYADVAEVRLRLADLDPGTTSVTYADSITAMGPGTAFGLPGPNPANAGRVYRPDQLTELDQLAELNQLEELEIPAPTPVTHRAGRAGTRDISSQVDFHTEIQVWSDAPIRAYLTTERTRP